MKKILITIIILLSQIGIQNCCSQLFTFDCKFEKIKGPYYDDYDDFMVVTYDVYSANKLIVEQSKGYKHYRIACTGETKSINFYLYSKHGSSDPVWTYELWTGLNLTNVKIEDLCDPNKEPQPIYLTLHGNVPNEIGLPTDTEIASITLTPIKFKKPELGNGTNNQGYYCEGESVPIIDNMFSLNSNSELYYNSGSESILQPQIFISPSGREDWKPITINDFSFNNLKSYVKTNFHQSIYNEQYSVKFKFAEYESETIKIAPFYEYYKFETIDENGETQKCEPYIQDNKLHIQLKDGFQASLDSYFYPSKYAKNTSEDIKNNNNIFPLSDNAQDKLDAGPYRLMITSSSDEIGSCAVRWEILMPEVKYNYVHQEKDSTVFWYEGDTAEAVSINFVYPGDPSEIEDLNGSGLDINIHQNINFYFKNNTGDMPVYDNSQQQGLEGDNPIPRILQHELNCDAGKMQVHRMDIFAAPPDEKSICKASFGIITNITNEQSDITIEASNRNSTVPIVPVKITIDTLKAYPNITEPTVEITNATCYYDTVKLNISNISGGLKDRDYKYVLQKGNTKIERESSEIKIPSSVFGLGKQTVDLYIYDKDKPDDDTGYGERNFGPKPVTFSYGDVLAIKDWTKSDLRCNGDHKGEIAVTDWTPKKDGIRFELWKVDEYGQSSQFLTSEPFSKLDAGKYRLKIFDKYNCEDQNPYDYIVTLEEPKVLETSIHSVTNAMCYGYHDGAITTKTTGGTEPYTYSWSNGATTKDIDHLPIGRYYLTVTDAHDCEAYANDSIQQPPELFNSLTPEYIICKGGELAIDDGKENPRLFTKYEWIQPDGTIKQGRPIVVDSKMPQGQYVLKSINEDNCYTLDTTLITFAENDLPVKFLVPSESFLADTLVIAEDSEIDADFNWYYEYNSEMFKDITEQLADRNKNQTYLWVERSGCDTITMFAENGFCKASLSKTVTILNDFRPEGYDFTIAAAGIFSRLQIGPNPNNGEFTLFANLTEESELDVRLYDVSRSRRIPLDFSKYKTPSDRYQIPFQGLGLRTGIYTLLVSANGETKQIKFVVE